MTIIMRFCLQLSPNKSHRSIRCIGCAVVLVGIVSGHGLGLAITRSNVEAHTGEIQARNRSEGSLLVSISLRTR